MLWLFVLGLWFWEFYVFSWHFDFQSFEYGRCFFPMVAGLPVVSFEGFKHPHLQCGTGLFALEPGLAGIMFSNADKQHAQPAEKNMGLAPGGQPVAYRPDVAQVCHVPDHPLNL